jgi:hypothetical protein
LNGLNELTIDEIHELRSKGKHIFPDVKKYYYYTREEGMEQYYKRFAQWYLLRKDLGLMDVGMNDPRNKVLHLANYALDNGMIALHYYAFLPAI